MVFGGLGNALLFFSRSRALLWVWAPLTLTLVLSLVRMSVRTGERVTHAHAGTGARKGNPRWKEGRKRRSKHERSVEEKKFLMFLCPGHRENYVCVRKWRQQQQQQQPGQLEMLQFKQEREKR